MNESHWKHIYVLMNREGAIKISFLQIYIWSKTIVHNGAFRECLFLCADMPKVIVFKNKNIPRANTNIEEILFQKEKSLRQYITDIN